MFTKEQLAKWESDGFTFPSEYNDWAVEEKNKKVILPNDDVIEESIILNNVALEFVKFLFKIRNANFYKTKIPYERFSAPYGGFRRERVFIAGKIFPVLNIFYSGQDADGTKISLKNFSTYELRLLTGEQNYPIYNINYISIDNDKIKILLPKSFFGINYEKLMLDFLTNGNLTPKTIGGEFPDYETYTLALRNKAYPEKSWKGDDGSWLLEDRDSNSTRWYNGYSYIIKHRIEGRLAPFKQIYDFYNAVDNRLFRVGHRVKWCKGAKKLVYALTIIDGLGAYAQQNDMETILSELNLGICDYAITQFHDLLYGKYASTALTGDLAYEWDRRFITYEQGTVAPPFYDKTASGTIAKFQDMVDQDSKGYNGMSGLVFSILQPVAPAFDVFDPPASVKDNQFRIDLPLLMLYLDKHKPIAKSFVKHCNADGTLNDNYKLKIRDYAI